MRNSENVLFPFSALLFALIFSFNCPIFAADRLPQERGGKPIEIKAGEERRNEELKEVKPVSEIREKETKMPEIPKQITRENLGPAEQARLAELENKRAVGKITETEYNLEKDTLFRESNIPF